MNVWVQDAARGLFLLGQGAMQRLCGAARCRLCLCERGVWCADHEGFARLYTRSDAHAAETIAIPPGPECMLCPHRADVLYVLSGEADSVHRIDARTGRWQLCAPAGVFPRDMALCSDGRVLAVAGGAADQVYLLNASSLSEFSRVRVPGASCAVAFCAGELYCLCVADERAELSLLCRVSPHGQIHEMLTLPGYPGALCALGDGTLLCGTASLITCVHAGRGRPLWRVEAGLPKQIVVSGGHAYVADALLGRAYALPLTRPSAPVQLYEGDDVTGVMVTG